MLTLPLVREDSAFPKYRKTFDYLSGVSLMLEEGYGIPGLTMQC